VQQSTNLQSWSTAPGYPATANGPAQQMPFLTDGKARFFRVRELDEQPPDIVNQYPQDGGFAVPRFANLTLQLSDVTGLDTNSLRLTVGDLGTFALTNVQLTLSNGVLTFLNGGSIPLGAWGTNVQATLVANDTLGNSGTNTWSFKLEVQPQVVTNLFVFGSPHAQRTGQRIGNIPTAALAARFGPIPMDDGDPWTLELVESNRLVLAYTNTAPGFATNTYVCNLTPVRPEHIFNRKIIGITDDPGNQRLTLFTVEVPLTEIVTNGSASISSGSVVLQTGTNGAFVRAFEIGGTITFPRTGYSLDGAEFKLRTNGFESQINGVTLSVGNQPDILRVTAEQLHWWLTPRLQSSLEINFDGLQRFEAIASGNVSSALILNADVLLVGLGTYDTKIYEIPASARPKTWMVIAVIGIPPFAVPVYATLGFNFEVTATAEARADLNFRFGLTQDADAAFGVTYTKPTSRTWIHAFPYSPPVVEPFTAAINGEASLKVSLKPKLEFLVYGLAGVSAGITPSGKIIFAGGTSTPLSGRIEADVNLDVGLAGPAFEKIFDPLPHASYALWNDEWYLFPDEAAIFFTQQPQSQTVQLDGSAYFSCTVAASGTPGYQWYFNGVPLPGQTARTLLLPSVSYGHAGNYQVRVIAGNQTSNSAPATLTVVPAGVPSGMALVPAGPFTMGDTFGEGYSYELPLHTVQVSVIYMDQFEVTKALWDEVLGWANTHGYDLGGIGMGKAANHPVHTVSWYDVVKWCNARSEREGRVPAYYTSAAVTTVYRSEQVDVQNNWVKWSSGYRLPTEAEWEKAARGGDSGQRFPWSGTNNITHSQANYNSSSSVAYDTSPTRGFHPSFQAGGYPYTSPVGSFAPNGYGLYDMAGNLWEWTWDWYGSYTASSATDPRGPTSGSIRVLRGGGWLYGAVVCRAAVRAGNDSGIEPTYRNDNYGFRTVLPPGQP
jgi:formylglycine-generating enzyme required for sulfatase activity